MNLECEHVSIFGIKMSRNGDIQLFSITLLVAHSVFTEILGFVREKKVKSLNLFSIFSIFAVLPP